VDNPNIYLGEIIIMMALMLVKQPTKISHWGVAGLIWLR
jgi:hypothetical protein